MSDDPLPLGLSLILIFLFVFLNGFFVAAEFAMVKVRGSRITTLVSEGNGKARFASRLTGNLNAFLSASQLGITLASLGLGWIGGPAIARALQPLFHKFGIEGLTASAVSFFIAFGFITLLHIVLGELAPKTIAIRKAEKVTLWTSIPLVYFHAIMFPFIWALDGLASLLLKWIGITPAADYKSAHNEEEIRILMQESHKSGLIDGTELALMDNIFDFSDTNAREIMIPRTDMVCLSLHHPFEQNKAAALAQKHTRYPVCEGDKDNIIGFVHIKDLLKATPEISELRLLLRPITAVPESMRISSLLKLMQRSKTGIAILIDEYGGTSGLVTLKDIMEEIVGDIRDEFDVEERAELEQIDASTFSLSGLMQLEDVNERFALKIDTETYATIGGWLSSHIGIPLRIGRSVSLGNGSELILEESEHLRVSRVLLRLGRESGGSDKDDPFN
ncbi:Hemolysin, contains CBS domains [Paenibacillaceae bacterium GAS479]|nr:Hemolysin, contains CBS domains [Paenibacillaceae bacterium GAS479]